jgi:lactate permease
MNLYLAFIIALIPIIFLIISLGVLKIPGYKACPIALVATMIIAISVWKMPVLKASAAALEGAALALWPIVVIIVAAVFTYNLSIYTKGMETIKKMLTSITTDQRILVLILAYGFGGFLEAIAGYGTSVAIPAGIMAAIGFEPIFAAIICLVANTTPTAFASVGLPITTLAKLTNLDSGHLGYAITLQLFILIIILPIVLVMITGRSVKAIKGVLGITLVAGISFAIPQLIAAKYLGAELPAIFGSVTCLISTITVAKLFYNREKGKSVGATAKEALMAWLPFILVFVFIILTSSLVPAINKTLSSVKTTIEIYPEHHNTFIWLASPGTLIILASFIGGKIQGASFGEIVRVFFSTCKQMSKSAVTILSIVALAKVMSYSGMIKNIAVVLVAATGSMYPFISPFVGTLGTFVTGSDTSANILFGELQVEVAKSLGINPYWLAAANTTGATAGKMISPQSIAVATAATGLIGAEGKILGTTIKFSLAYALILGIITLFARNLLGF